MRKILMAALLLCLPGIYGFATIISGKHQNVTINSDPKGAKVMAGGITIGVTPIFARIKREKNMVLVLSKEGYEDQIIHLTTGLNYFVFANIIFGTYGTSSTSTDAASGATIEYSPDSYYATLAPKKASKMEKDRLNLKILTRNFVLLNYHSLTSDIARGQGEYLSNLYAILNIDEANQIRTLSYLQEMLYRYSNVPGFAENVVHGLTSI